jgi:hypothetical protein
MEAGEPLSEAPEPWDLPLATAGPSHILEIKPAVYSGGHHTVENAAMVNQFQPICW